MFQFRASVADSGPILNQYCLYGMDSWNLLNATIKITVAINKVESMLFKCWASIADSITTLSQQRYKSMCVLGTLTAIPFDKQIYIYLKMLKLSGDF